jgi:hypothetical protein
METLRTFQLVQQNVTVQAIADLRCCREAEWQVNSNVCEKRPHFICTYQSPVYEGGWRTLLGDNTCRGRSCSSVPESGFQLDCCQYMHSWQCTYWIDTCTKFDLRLTCRAVTAVSVQFGCHAASSVMWTHNLSVLVLNGAVHTVCAVTINAWSPH